MKNLYFTIIIGTVFTLGLVAQTQEVVLTPAKDNTIYEEGDLSNGAGDHLFTGVIKTGERRRALIKFDPASVVPEGKTVDSVKVIFHPTRLKANGTPVTLHTVTWAWGEGDSEAAEPEGKGAPATDNDATWTQAVRRGDAWANPGGDFDPDTAAISSATLLTKTVFRSSKLTEDVNSWITTPSGNHGWILIGDESATTTAIRFSSRENELTEEIPTLVLYYQDTATSIFQKPVESTFFVYNGPGMGDIIVKSKSPANDLHLEVYSVTGRLVYSETQIMAGQESKFSSGIDQEGIYVYRIISEGTTQSGKLLFRGQ